MVFLTRYKELETGKVYRIIQKTTCSEVYILENVHSKKRKFVREADLRRQYVRLQ